MAIEANQIVSIEYEVKDGDTVVDSNMGGAPLVFMFGKGQIISGLENGIVNMAIGEKADILVEPADAYGEFNDDASQEVPKDQFAGIDLAVGMTLYGQGEDGATTQVIVKEIGEENITIDFNHPLAGKALMFSVTINNIRDASAEEVMTGIPAENKPEEGESCGTGCGCH
ncbi:MAG: peptidylprolyl isomerase [Sulfurimonas sp.]|nr:peptidylprolyl isomerase [Sulfurimonas sp.]MDQ7061575.1 peptidylprolyl isomerase [Sulfurimonas sp.]